MSLESDVFGDEDDEIRGMSTEAIISRTRMIQTEINVHKQEIAQLNYRFKDQQEKTKDNKEKIKLNKQLPYLVANVVEVRPPRIAPHFATARGLSAPRRSAHKVIEPSWFNPAACAGRSWTLRTKRKKTGPQRTQTRRRRESVLS